jgi:hypothetical protein
LVRRHAQRKWQSPRRAMHPLLRRRLNLDMRCACADSFFNQPQRECSHKTTAWRFGNCGVLLQLPGL